MTDTHYLNIENKYGHYASWAIWKPKDNFPTSNIGDLTHFKIDSNSTILELVKPDFIMVGLNISRPINFKFGNFHDSRPHSKDYKLRHALNDTILWGAYMTDIIKDFENVISGDVMKYLKSNPDFEKINADIFLGEIKYLGAPCPKLIALGNDTYFLLNKYFKGVFPILKLPHYSMYISMENYKLKVNELINKWLNDNNCT